MTIDGYGTEADGYQRGTIDWLLGGTGREDYWSRLSANTTDDDLGGEGVSFSHVMLYDLEGKRWYNQSTDYRGEPLKRTRFARFFFVSSFLHSTYISLLLGVGSRRTGRLRVSTYDYILPYPQSEAVFVSIAANRLPTLRQG